MASPGPKPGRVIEPALIRSRGLTAEAPLGPWPDDDADDADRQALVRRAPDPLAALTDPGPGSRLPVARSLSEATPRTLVSLDSRGQVRSPARRLLERAAAYGALGLMGSMTLVSASLGDPLGMTIGLTATAMWAHGVVVARWLERASALMIHGQLDQAEAILRRCLLPPWGSHSVRAHAHLRLSGVATRRGDHTRAVAEIQEAIALFEEERPRQAQFLEVARYQEIRALVSAGRLADARLKMEEIPEVPEGDYLRMQHYVSELYVALVDGRMPFSDQPLWERAHMALQLSAAAPLLALCAWGYFKLGELDMAWHLLQTAYDRLEGEPLDKMMPELWRFMEAKRKEAQGEE
jgi:tetratricopeptide (TPR) repeat protein